MLWYSLNCMKCGHFWKMIDFDKFQRSKTLELTEYVVLFCISWNLVYIRQNLLASTLVNLSVYNIWGFNYQILSPCNVNQKFCCVLVYLDFWWWMTSSCNEMQMHQKWITLQIVNCSWSKIVENAFYFVTLPKRACINWFIWWKYSD